MQRKTTLSKLEPEEQEAHNAIVQAIFNLIKMIVSFFTGRKKKSDNNVSL